MKWATAKTPRALRTATDLAWRQRDAVLHRSARVDLLFGPGRDTSRCANDVVRKLASAVPSLMAPSLDAHAAEHAHVKAAEALRGFHLAASDAIQAGKPPTVARKGRL